MRLQQHIQPVECFLRPAVFLVGDAQQQGSIHIFRRKPQHFLQIGFRCPIESFFHTDGRSQKQEFLAVEARRRSSHQHIHVSTGQSGIALLKIAGGTVKTHFMTFRVDFQNLRKHFHSLRIVSPSHGYASQIVAHHYGRSCIGKKCQRTLKKFLSLNQGITAQGIETTHHAIAPLGRVGRSAPNGWQIILFVGFSRSHASPGSQIDDGLCRECARNHEDAQQKYVFR